MFVTFYSYKGGVGRSMALANIACLLAQDHVHPQRVLLWDFDLEAPGLHRLFPPKQPHAAGFVDLAHKYAQTGKVPELRDYIYASVIDGIDILPAGSVGQAYCEKLQELHWPAFFSADPSDAGPFFGPVRDAVNRLGYDYILIDSRTGLNDQAGICTEILPDLIVVLFRLTAQNLDGLAHVVPMFRYQLEARKRGGVRILPIASVVSPTSSKATLENKDKAVRLFRERHLRYIRFDSDLVTDERLFCLKKDQQTIWPIPPVIEDYQNLCAAIREHNKEDTKTQTEIIKAAMEEGDLMVAASSLKTTIERRVRNPELWRILGILFNAGVLKDTGELVDRILQRDPQNRFCFEWKGMRRLEEADSPLSPELEVAKSEFEKAISSSARPNPQLYRTLTCIYSCQGDLENAVKCLRMAQQRRNTKNVQMNFELALLHMRMGAKYFSSAIDSLQEIRDGIDEKHLWLAYLYAFLDEPQKADEAFGIYRQQQETWDEIYHAHFLLLKGRREDAIDLAEICNERGIIDDDRINWAEFFICAKEFGRALSLLKKGGGKESTDGPEDVEHLQRLCSFLSGAETDQQKLIKDWQEIRWGFKELILFRERTIKNGESELFRRLAVLEELIRYQDLRSFRRSRGRVIVSGTSGIGSLRMVASSPLRDLYI